MSRFLMIETGDTYTTIDLTKVIYIQKSKDTYPRPKIVFWTESGSYCVESHEKEELDGRYQQVLDLWQAALGAGQTTPIHLPHSTVEASPLRTCYGYNSPCCEHNKKGHDCSGCQFEAKHKVYVDAFARLSRDDQIKFIHLLFDDGVLDESLFVALIDKLIDKLNDTLDEVDTPNESKSKQVTPESTVDTDLVSIKEGIFTSFKREDGTQLVKAFHLNIYKHPVDGTLVVEDKEFTPTVSIVEKQVAPAGVDSAAISYAMDWLQGVIESLKYNTWDK